MPDNENIEQNEQENEVLEEDELAICQKEKNEYLLGWQRCKADAINIKQQQESRHRDIIQFAGENLIQSLLPVLDTFDHALQGKDLSDPYVQGFGHVRTQFLSILSQHGLTVISDTGVLFDVSRHEAVESIPVAHEKDTNRIMETVENGYILYGKVIKPAKVKIGEYKKHGS